MPTISTTLKALRQRISAAIGDCYTGLCSGGTGTTITMTGAPAALGSNYFQGAEVSIVAGTGAGTSRRITSHTVAGATATLTVATGTTSDATSEYEIHNFQGRGFSKANYDYAINAALDSLADLEFTDLDSVAFACERGAGISTHPVGTLRDEYPMPSGFNWLWGVDILGYGPTTWHGTGNLRAFRNLGDVTARTRLGQGFQCPQDTLVSYIAVYMGKVGAPTDNLTCVVETDSSGVPSGTAVTNGTSGTVAGSTLQTRARYVVFTFDPPLLLTQDTQYHLTLRKSTAVSATDYYTVGEDTSAQYSYGTASTRDASTWTAVSTSDFLFAVSPASNLWVPMAKANWRYQPQNTDQLKLMKLPREGVPIRLRGGAAIARVSAETDSIPVRPEYVEAFALAYLQRGKAGRQSPDNFGQNLQAWSAELGIVPPPARSLPANSVRIR
jgi:hypothetical protein